MAPDPYMQHTMPQYRPQAPRVSRLYPTPPPNGTPPVGTSHQSQPVHPAPPAPVAEVFKPGQIVAWVGDQPIQAGDLMPMVEQMLAGQLEKLPPEAIEAQKGQIEEAKQKLLKQALDGAIDTKLLYLDFLRSLPADKRDEVLPNVTSQVEKAFYDEQLPDMIKRAKLSSPAELEAELRKYGSSIKQQKRAFVESTIGRSMLAQKIDRKPEVTHQEMLDYYRENAKDFDVPAQARWEKLTVRFDRFATKGEAWEAISNMGNEVLRGAAFSAVAKRHSQGVDARDGGYHDWTTKGSLASEVLDNAIFTLPIERLSERLEDERGFHIVRVKQRRDAGRVPFVKAQVEIKEKLRKQKRNKQIAEHIARVKKEIHVWTIFDQES
jgi:parvulin-like peptidyl-prolyl isomerase